MHLFLLRAWDHRQFVKQGLKNSQVEVWGPTTQMIHTQVHVRIVCDYKLLVKLSPLYSVLVFEAGSSGSLLEPCRWWALTLSEPASVFAVPYALLTCKNRSSSSPSLLKPLMGKLIKVLCCECASFSCQIINTFQSIFQ